MATVKRGDTLSAIARRAGVSLGALLAANPQISNPNLIHPGQNVRVPRGQVSKKREQENLNRVFIRQARDEQGNIVNVRQELPGGGFAGGDKFQQQFGEAFGLDAPPVPQVGGPRVPDIAPDSGGRFGALGPGLGGPINTEQVSQNIDRRLSQGLGVTRGGVTATNRELELEARRQNIRQQEVERQARTALPSDSTVGPAQRAINTIRPGMTAEGFTRGQVAETQRLSAQAAAQNVRPPSPRQAPETQRAQQAAAATQPRFGQGPGLEGFEAEDSLRRAEIRSRFAGQPFDLDSPFGGSALIELLENRGFQVPEGASMSDLRSILNQVAQDPSVTPPSSRWINAMERAGLIEPMNAFVQPTIGTFGGGGRGGFGRGGTRPSGGGGRGRRGVSAAALGLINWRI